MKCIPIIQRIFFKHFTWGCGLYCVQKVRNQLKNEWSLHTNLGVGVNVYAIVVAI
jgi:hypothetical protein